MFGLVAGGGGGEERANGGRTHRHRSQRHSPVNKQEAQWVKKQTKNKQNTHTKSENNRCFRHLQRTKCCFHPFFSLIQALPTGKATGTSQSKCSKLHMRGKHRTMCRPAIVWAQSVRVIIILESVGGPTNPPFQTGFVLAASTEHM